MRNVLKLLRAHPLLVFFALLGVVYAIFGDSLPDVDIEKILEDLSASLGKWTYLLVGLLAFLETGAFVGLVFPGETAVIVGGVVAGQGEISIVLLIAIVWTAAWAGDTVSFFIGRRLGRGFILKHGPRVRITHERFAQVERYFERHGGKTILVGRFLGLIRALAPFIAGSSGMAYRAFLPYSVLGTGLWAGTFSVLGYALAGSLDKAGEIAGRGTLLFGSVVVTTVAVVVVVRYMRVEANRHMLAQRLEGTRVGRPVVALGRRIEPQARFLWRRITPGGLGLEFTSVMAMLSVSLFIVVGYGLIVEDKPGPTAGDKRAFEIVDELRSDAFTDVAKVVTEFGSGEVTLAVALLAAIGLGVAGRRMELAVLVAATVLVHIAVPSLKELLDRPRPPGGLVDASGAAWPSGHATYAILYPWLAMTAALRLRPGAVWGTALITAGFTLAAAIGLSRVYLGVHFLSDVSGGAALGVALFALCMGIALVVSHFRKDDRRDDAPGS